MAMHIKVRYVSFLLRWQKQKGRKDERSTPSKKSHSCGTLYIFFHVFSSLDFHVISQVLVSSPFLKYQYIQDSIFDFSLATASSQVISFILLVSTFKDSHTIISSPDLPNEIPSFPSKCLFISL